MISIITSYLKRLSDTELLSPEDELFLARKIEQGDLDAKNKLIESNLRLVVSIAKRYMGYGIPFSDLIQAGNEGLIKASERYDWRRGVKFSTVAEQWITQAISSYMSQNSKTIRTPYNVVSIETKYRRFVEAYKTKNGSEPLLKEVAKEIGIETESLREIIKRMNNVVSIDDIVGEDFRLEDVLEDNFRVFDEVLSNMMGDDLHKALDILNDREKYIILKRFGLDDDAQHNLEDIGKELGLSRERVRQIERDAINTLRSSDDSMIKHLRVYL